MPRATANIDGMRRVIDALIARGCAYVAGATGRRAVYFSVESFARYGALSGNTLDALQSGAGGRITEGNQQEKRHPADFLLWKEDSAHIMKWDSPGGIDGQGYPGWHIECTVMSARLLLGDEAFGRLISAGGRTADAAIIDIHSGGEDNIFPHHECEMAQSSCAFCADAAHGTFARLWFHPRFLFVEGAKMSKSKGNFFTARDLFAKGYEPAAVRLELIKTHYRSNANFTEQGLKDSQRTVERFRRFADAARAGGAPAATGGASTPVEQAFADAMNDDLNIAGALGELNKWINQTPSPGAAEAAALARIDAVLGLLELEKPASAQTDLGVFLDGLAPDPAVIAKLVERLEAKKARDFARSDAIRDQLAAMGYAIKDVAGGKVEVRRK
jgi:cysteinyl-tRNA synthetase